MPNWVAIAQGMRTANNFYQQFRQIEKDEREEERAVAAERRAEAAENRAGLRLTSDLKTAKQGRRLADSQEQRAGVKFEREGETHKRSIRDSDQQYGHRASAEAHRTTMRPLERLSTKAGINASNSRTRYNNYRIQLAKANEERDSLLKDLEVKERRLRVEELTEGKGNRQRQEAAAAELAEANAEIARVDATIAERKKQLDLLEKELSVEGRQNANRLGAVNASVAEETQGARVRTANAQADSAESGARVRVATEGNTIAKAGSAASLAETQAGLAADTRDATTRTRNAQAGAAESGLRVTQATEAGRISTAGNEARMSDLRRRQGEREELVRSTTAADVQLRQELEAANNVEGAKLVALTNQATRNKFTVDATLDWYEAFQHDPALMLDLVKTSPLGSPDAAHFQVNGDTVTLVDVNGVPARMKMKNADGSPRIAEFSIERMEAMQSHRDRDIAAAREGDENGDIWVIGDEGKLIPIAGMQAYGKLIESLNEGAAPHQRITMEGADRLLLATPDMVKAHKQRIADDVSETRKRSARAQGHAKYTRKAETPPPLVEGVAEWRWSDTAPDPDDPTKMLPRYIGVPADGSTKYIDPLKKDK